MCFSDYTIRYCDLSGRVKGFTTRAEDGHYIIVLNSKLNEEQQKAALLHELAHIENGDFELESGDINDIERCTHQC